MKHFNPARLIERRKRLHKTQFEVAKEAGISLASVSYIEKGKKKPRADTLIKLAHVLKCKVDYFYTN